MKIPFFTLIMACLMLQIACKEFLDLILKSPSYIEITQHPSKTIYLTDEAFDPAGLVVTAFYSDGSSGPIIIGHTLSTPDMSSAGTKEITVTYQGKTASFNIKVANVPVTITSIAVTANPVKTAYYVNDTFDKKGLVVTATYSDGSSGPITGYFLSAPAMSSTGTKTITVTYGDKATSFTITVDTPPEVTLSSITVTQIPSKTIYHVGETFDPAGLEVKAVYSNGSSGVITGYTLSTPNMSSEGTKTITVNFEGKEARFNIVVNNASLASITVTAPPSKTAYHVNDTFNPAGLVVTAFYSNGSSGVITGYTLSAPAMNSAGTKTITVTYSGMTTSFDITVTPVNTDTGDIGIIVY